ncbi:MAG: ABC transporter permease [Verrucomicrobia bacterium]|nr:ABC transporter permease [Verrucomicrobiota bacterium]
MQEIRFIATLTVQSALRMRFAQMLSAVLLLSVIVLPSLIRHNGTAKMFAQVLVTYSLSLITALLAISTLWLACAAMANDLEGGQLQMLVCKPISRWRIWLGKWIGIMVVQIGLLILAGTAAYAALEWQARELPPGEQEKLRREILVSRGERREPSPDLTRDATLLAEKRRKERPLNNVPQDVLLKEVASEVRALHETVAPGYRRWWVVDLGPQAEVRRNKPISLRVQFHAAHASADGLFRTVWIVGGDNNPKAFRQELHLGAGVEHEIPLPPGLLDAQGKLDILCENRAAATLLFRMEDGLAVLFPEGSFLANYARGLTVIACWIALVAALGVTAGVFLSFPVATVLVVSLFLAGLSGETFAEVVREGTIASFDNETGRSEGSLFDGFFVPMAKVFSYLSRPVESVSPIAALSTGRRIPWVQVLQAAGQVSLALGGMTAVAGMLILTRREISRTG